MADIGSTLRETRIRDKIDITAVEESTKIRTKYLRALENEEWGVLPGPTYVKSFLRTYAEFLGLDAHMLIEEYRARYERPEELELPAFARDGPLRGRVRPPGPPSRAIAIMAVIVGFLVLLFVLGITAGDENGKQRSAGEPSSKGARSEGGNGSPAGSGAGRASEQPRGASGEVALSVVASRPVWVCLVDAKGRRLVEGRTLRTGAHEGPFRSKRFKVTLGNGGGDLRIDGKLRQVPNSAVPLGYSIGPSRMRRLPAAERPTCAASGNGASAPAQAGTASPAGAGSGKHARGKARKSAPHQTGGANL
jgi:cytoskeleton protein RodZ